MSVCTRDISRWEAKKVSAPRLQSPCRKSRRASFRIWKSPVLCSLINGWPAIRLSLFCLPSDCLSSAFCLPSDCLSTAFCLPPDYLSSAFCLSSDCLSTAICFSSAHFPFALLPPDSYLPSICPLSFFYPSFASPTSAFNFSPITPIPIVYSPFFGSVQFTNKLILVFLNFNELSLTLINESF